MENQISMLFVGAHGRAPLPEPFLAKIMKYTPLPIAAEPRPQEVPSVTSPLRETIVVFVGADGCPPGNFAHRRKSCAISVNLVNQIQGRPSPDGLPPPPGAPFDCVLDDISLVSSAISKMAT